MLSVLEAESWILLVVDLVLLAVKVAAFVSSLMHPAEAYTAASKMTKPAWTIILGLGLVVQIVWAGSGPMNLVNLAFTIAAFVYLADVRPALVGLRRR
jgi:hypothetical protein